jgi:Flp pilus assembly protein TadG
VRTTRTHGLRQWRRGLRAFVRKRVRSDRGASAIELVIIAPILLLASMLIIWFAMWFDARHAAIAAAQEGDLVARQEAGNPQLSGAWEGDASNAAVRFYRGLDTAVLKQFSATAAPASSQSRAGAIEDVSVTVSGTLDWLVPINISVTVSGPEECFHTVDTGGTQCP